MQETLEWLANAGSADPNILPPGLENWDPVPFLASAAPISLSVFSIQFLHDLGHRAAAFIRKASCPLVPWGFLALWCRGAHRVARHTGAGAGQWSACLGSRLPLQSAFGRCTLRLRWRLHAVPASARQGTCSKRMSKRWGFASMHIAGPGISCRQKKLLEAPGRSAHGVPLCVRRGCR